MRTFRIGNLNIGRIAALFFAVLAVQMFQPTSDAQSGDIIWARDGLFFGQVGSQLSTRGILSNAPSIRVEHNDKALQAYKSGDFATARKLWETAAGKGDIYAQWMLAKMYRLGQGVDVDDAMAFKYYQAVAGKFNGQRNQKSQFIITVDAHFWLASYYKNGVNDAGIEKRPKNAFKIYNFAANNGHPAGQYELAIFFFDGKVIKRNDTVGMRWIRASAQKRHAPAMALLGSIYWGGTVVKKNRAKGLMWYNLAKEYACPSIDPGIFDKYEELYTAASDTERSKAEALAYRWQQENPLKEGQLIYRIADCN